MRISDWSSDGCSSDLVDLVQGVETLEDQLRRRDQERRARVRLAGQARRPLQEPGDPLQTLQLLGGREGIGIASWRERVCQYVCMSVGAVAYQKNSSHPSTARDQTEEPIPT